MAISPGLTKQRIVAAGLEVLDEHGLDGLTVRAVASRLSVQAPALYWHVRNKQVLLDEMATEMWRAIFAAVDALPEETPWQEGLSIFANETRRTLLSHREGAKVFSGTFLTDMSILEKQESRLQGMLADGFALVDALRASELVYDFTIGFCIEEQSFQQAIANGYTLESRSRRFDENKTPLVIESGIGLFGNQDQRFSSMIAILIEAAERMRN
jgi:TetR/AcrR family transcriptional regulator, tetracycline repressor protein